MELFNHRGKLSLSRCTHEGVCAWVRLRARACVCCVCVARARAREGGLSLARRRTQLLRQERYVFNDGHPHAPLVVFGEVDDGG